MSSLSSGDRWIPAPPREVRADLSSAATHVKPLADTLWTLVRWTLPLSVAAVIVAAALGSQRIGEEVRRRVEIRLREKFPELEVTVRSASLVEGEGIIIRGVSLSADGREQGVSAMPGGGPMLTIEEIDVYRLSRAP